MNYAYLNENYSTDLIDKFRNLYDAVIASGIAKKQHMKYTLRPEHTSFYLDKFPWLHNIPLWNPATDNIIFLLINASLDEYKDYSVHKDPGNVISNINVPIYNCGPDTVTYWVEPIGELKVSWEGRIGNKVKEGELVSEQLKNDYKIIDECKISDRCVLFNGANWHKVESKHNRNEERVMCKICHKNISWDTLYNYMESYIDVEYRILTT